MSKVGSLSFVSPVSASDISNPIFEIKATEDKINIFTYMLPDPDNIYVKGRVAL